MKFSADFIIIKRIRREKNDDDFKCTMLNDKRFNYLRNFYEIKKKTYKHGLLYKSNMCLTIKDES